MSTKIEWADETCNPVVAINKATGRRGHYCAKVNAACAGCYAEAFQPRFRNPIRYAAQDRDQVEILFDAAIARKPLHWKKPRRIFWVSMSDAFGPWVEDAWLDTMFAVAALTPQHDHIFLTKRPERMRDYMLERWQGTPAQDVGGMHVPAGGETGRRSQIEEACEPLLDELGLSDPAKDDLWTEDGKCRAMQWEWPLPNVRLGVTVHDQPSAEAFVPILLATPAACRIVSYEPALGPVDFTNLDYHVYLDSRQRTPRPDPDDDNWPQMRYDALRGHLKGPDDIGLPKLDQIIAGGESGARARPAHPDWFRKVRDDCQAAGVAFLFKQWGGWLPGQNEVHPDVGQECAHWQDGGWGPRDAPNPVSRNYVMWDRNGVAHPGGSRGAPDYFEVAAWAQRVSKKAAGRQLDGRTWDQEPPRAPGRP